MNEEQILQRLDELTQKIAEQDIFIESLRVANKMNTEIIATLTASNNRLSQRVSDLVHAVNTLTMGMEVNH